jgi:Na+/H+ antiporter NhaD/arsenite permease-like protein/uncharacterized membrane protein (UPF0127 family)
MVTALIIFIITYLFIGLRQIPRVHIDRPAGALVGAVLMVLLGVLSLDEAFAAVDLHTILLLLGMMIITVYLRAAGFFEVIAERIITLSRTPLQLLVLVVLSSAILSALFVNDTICLLYTPIILEVTAQLAINPMPYLLALATASNIGSVMTITGNPQNMLIGIYSKISYLSFFGALVPVAFIGLAIVIVVLRYVYRKDISTVRFDHRPSLLPAAVNRPLLARSLAVCAGVLVAFSLGHPYSLTAAAGAVVLMLIGGVRTERILEGVDWTLLLFFAGLFVVMHGVEVSGLAGAMIGWAGDLTASSTAGRIAGLSLVSAVLSNVVSNVPAVMLLRPFIESLGGDRIAWLALAMSSTLAGNFTLIGSVANLIVAQQARKRVEIGFMEYFRVGALITVITMAAGIAVLIIEVKIARGEEHVSAVPARDMTVTVTAAGTPARQRIFRVALLCDTAEEQRQGLQGFRQLAAGEAALFPYERPVEVTFWMGSVPYPIDIIFVSPDDTVSRVFRDCLPGQTSLYTSGRPVRWVIETAAGSGVREGDRVRIE